MLRRKVLIRVKSEGWRVKGEGWSVKREEWRVRRVERLKSWTGWKDFMSSWGVRAEGERRQPCPFIAASKSRRSSWKSPSDSSVVTLPQNDMQCARGFFGLASLEWHEERYVILRRTSRGWKAYAVPVYCECKKPKDLLKNPTGFFGLRPQNDVACKKIFRSQGSLRMTWHARRFFGRCTPSEWHVVCGGFVQRFASYSAM